MTRFALLSLFAALFLATLANAQCQDRGCLFYGGDFDINHANANALANETDGSFPGDPYGIATYQNWVVFQDSTVAGLFTNNLSTLSPASGYWEIRSGISEGNGGTLIASGTGSGPDFSHTATGRSGFGYNEYTDLVTGLNVDLSPGTYWFAVVPNDPNNMSGRSFNTNTFGLNSIGTQISDMQYLNCPNCDINFTNADNAGVYPTFSSGVLGVPAPEPSSLIMLASGVIVAAGAVRRRFSR